MGPPPTGVTITADKPTNSLVIVAPPEAYAVIKEIIQKLDIRRSQVLVESLIAEITLDKTNQLGVEWQIIDPSKRAQVFGSSLGTGGTGLLSDVLSGAADAATTGALGLTRQAWSLALYAPLRSMIMTFSRFRPSYGPFRAMAM